MVFSQGKVFAQLNGNGYTIDKNLPSTSTNFVSFRSFFAALDSQGVSGPVSIKVNNGPYTEQAELKAINGASAANTITINGNNQVIQFAAGSISACYTLRFAGTDYVTVKNLSIYALGSAFACGVHFTGNADNNRLEDCIISVPNYSGSKGYGILVATDPNSPFTPGNVAKGLSVEGCTISGDTFGGPTYGIFINPQANAVSSGIRIKANFISDFLGVGIYLTNSKNVNIIGNRINRVALRSISDTYGIQLVNACSEDTIEGNRIYDCFKNVVTGLFVRFTGIYVQTVQALQVSNNAVYENNNDGEWYGIYLDGTPNTKIMHNTVSHDNTSTINNNWVYGFYHDRTSSTSSSGSFFKNNIISIRRSSSRGRYAIYQKGSSIPIDYNNLVMSAGSNTYYGWANGVSYQTFADWQASTYDINSVSFDPKYAGISAGDISPETIMLDGVGTPLGITADINNLQRDNLAPDPGAAEFMIDANVNDIVMPNSGCQGAADSVRVWIKNNSLFTISGFDVAYRVNSGSPVEEFYPGTINAGDSAKYVFSQPLVYSLPGNYSITTRIGAKPFYGPHDIFISLSPVGLKFGKGLPYKGQFTSGISADPDIVAPGDTVAYDIQNFSVFPNSDYGSAWEFKQLNVSEKSGGKVNAADTVVIYPSAAGNGKLKFVPSAGLADKRVVITILPYSINNHCEAPPIVREIYVAPRPTASFSFNNICDKGSVPFSNTSTILSGTLQYRWKFGDGDSSRQRNPVKKYAAPGNYKVTLYATSAYGYTDSLTKIVMVYPNPLTNFSYINKCEGVPIKFTNQSAGNGALTYAWNFGDGKGASTDSCPVYLYTRPDVYMVKLTVTDSKGCKGDTTRPVTFSKSPLAKFSFPPLTCNQKKVQFTNNSIPAGATGYTWFFGDGDSATNPHTEHTYQLAGLYKVKLVARNGFDCIDTISSMITLVETPVANFSLSSHCASMPIQYINLTNEPAGADMKYYWQLGDGTDDSIKNPIHTYAVVGKYPVTLRAEANQLCSSEVKTTIEFYERPYVNFQSVANACEGDKVFFKNGSRLSDSLAPLNYLWTFGNGADTMVENPWTVYNKSGIYLIRLLASSGAGCYDSIEKNIIVAPVPNSNFIVESGKTADGRIVFTPAIINGAGDYIWLYGDGQTGSSKGRHEVQYMSNGNFMVSLRIKNNECTSVTSQTVFVNPLSTGDELFAESGYEIYPNPATNTLIIKTKEQKTIGAIQIINSIGQLEYCTRLAETATNNSYAIDISMLTSGVYSLSVAFDGGQCQFYKFSVLR